jgi:hypothetical protein
MMTESASALDNLNLGAFYDVDEALPIFDKYTMKKLTHATYTDIMSVVSSSSVVVTT